MKLTKTLSVTRARASEVVKKEARVEVKARPDAFDPKGGDAELPVSAKVRGPAALLLKDASVLALDDVCDWLASAQSGAFLERCQKLMASHGTRSARSSSLAQSPRSTPCATTLPSSPTTSRRTSRTWSARRRITASAAA